jgi:outer membrane protein assembly factor BamB
VQALRETDPRRIGPYTVLGRLGAGGMGEVYLAETVSGLRLAVKVVRSEHAEDRTFRARFRQEVRAAQTVGGTGTFTARVVDADTESERPWMATEFVDGPNLRDAVLDHGPLPEEAVWVVAAALGEALIAIHAQGLVHRDLKPSNILLSPDGPRVIDFGIVRALEATALTRTGTVVGSSGYLSPEQIRNNAQVGPPSDVFSLGTVLAYAATGREPFGEGQDAVILMRILNGDVDLSGVPELLRAVVEACLARDPDERPTPATVVEVTGYTSQVLRQRLRPDWFTAVEPLEEGERWMPERGASMQGSRVEFLAPLTVVGTPSRKQAAPSRRRLLQGLAAGALAAAGAGFGGWLLSRDGDDVGGVGTKDGTKSDSGASRYSAPPPRPAVVAWRHSTDGLGGGTGPCVALSPARDTLYVGGLIGALHALTPDGAVLWEMDLGAMVQAPAVNADAVYCVVGSGRRLCAVAPKGRVRWQRDFSDEPYYMAPVVIGRLVIVSTDVSVKKGSVRAYRYDGSVGWTVRMPDPLSFVPVAADGVVYVGTFGRQLTAVDIGGGKRLWTSDLDFVPGRPALVGRTLVVPADGERTVQGISVTGEKLWAAHNAQLGFSGLVTDVECATFGNLAVTTSIGSIVAVDATDGSAAWRLHGDGDVYNYSNATVQGSLVYACLGKVLYAADRKGRQKHALTFPDATLASAYRPVLTHADTEYAYVGTREGILAVDLSA